MQLALVFGVGVLAVAVLLKTRSWPIVVVPAWLAVLAVAMALWPVLLLVGSAVLFVFWWLPGEALRRLTPSRATVGAELAGAGDSESH